MAASHVATAMPILWILLLFLHVSAAVFWVGGQLMLSIVVAPLLRRNADPATLRTLASAAGRRFGLITTTVLLPVLIVTGTLLAWHQGVRPTNITTTTYGQVLLIKALVVVVVFTLGAFHAVVARRMALRAGRVFALLTLALSLLIVLLASVLASLPAP